MCLMLPGPSSLPRMVCSLLRLRGLPLHQDGLVRPEAQAASLPPHGPPWYGPAVLRRILANTIGFSMSLHFFETKNSKVIGILIDVG